jgi:hypothetical protein
MVQSALARDFVDLDRLAGMEGESHYATASVEVRKGTGLALYICT